MRKLPPSNSIYAIQAPWSHIAYVGKQSGRMGKAHPFQGPCTYRNHSSAWNWWRQNNCRWDSLSRLSAAIVLCKKELAVFAKHLPGRVHYIPHGVDIDFFRAAKTAFGAPVAKAGRSVACLVEPGCGIWTCSPKWSMGCWACDKRVHFDIIVPLDKREHPGLKLLLQRNRIVWHANLTDAELRAVYGKSPLAGVAADRLHRQTYAFGSNSLRASGVAPMSAELKITHAVHSPRSPPRPGATNGSGRITNGPAPGRIVPTKCRRAKICGRATFLGNNCGTNPATVSKTGH